MKNKLSFIFPLLISLLSLAACSDIPHRGSHCQIKLLPVAVQSSEFLPKSLVNKVFYHDNSGVILSCRNDSLDIDFVVVRHKVCTDFRYQDQFIVIHKGSKQAIDIEGHNQDVLSQRYFNSPDNAIIACVSEGPLLVFVLKNGLISFVEIQKNEEPYKPHSGYKLLRAVSHAKGYLPKTILLDELDEKNCRIMYDHKKKAFVFYYVASDALVNIDNKNEKETVLLESNPGLSQGLRTNKVSEAENKKISRRSLFFKQILLGAGLAITAILLLNYLSKLFN